MDALNRLVAACRTLRSHYPEKADTTGVSEPLLQAAVAERTLKVQPRHVYGRWQFYPANDAAQALADTAGTATLTPHTLVRAKRMGLRVAVEAVDTADHMLRRMIEEVS